DMFTRISRTGVSISRMTTIIILSGVSAIKFAYQALSTSSRSASMALARLRLKLRTYLLRSQSALRRTLIARGLVPYRRGGARAWVYLRTMVRLNIRIAARHLGFI